MVADKNYNLITLVIKIMMLLSLYRDIFRTLAELEQLIQVYSGMFIHSGTFRNIQPCSGILRDNEGYWGIFRHYWGVRATIRHNYSAWPLHRQSRHIQNSGLFRTEGIFKSLPNTSDKHAYSEAWHSQDSLFNHFRRHLGILRDIDAY